MKKIRKLTVQISLFFAFLTLFSSCYTTKSYKEPVYKTVYENKYITVEKVKYDYMKYFFVGRNGQPVRKPVSLAFFNFVDSYNQNKVYNDIKKEFLNKLMEDNNFFDKFQPYPTGVLQSVYNINCNNIFNRTSQRKLVANKIYFSVGGIVNDPSFDLIVIRNSDGKVMVRKTVKNSYNSDAFTDAVKIIMESKEPVYYKDEIYVGREQKKVIDHYETKYKQEYDEASSKALFWTVIIIGSLILIANIPDE